MDTPETTEKAILKEVATKGTADVSADVMNYDWAVYLCRNNGLKGDYWPLSGTYTFTTGTPSKVTHHPITEG